jgi:FAD/FMN-containing dehydrogenase
MNRRRLLQAAATLPFLPGVRSRICASGAAQDARAMPPPSRVRPGDAGWPSQSDWDSLDRQVEGRLIKVRSPLSACQANPVSEPCNDVFKELKNPYYIGDQVGLTQTTGWIDAWTSQPSTYAVAAETTDDVVAAVNFARRNALRLVIKGGGHSYLGTSNAPDSLLIWTRRMNAMTLHDAFVAQGCAGQAPSPAVTIGAGAIWMHAYNEVTTRGGRYVQGGGCGTVGVAGLVKGGGFGSFSKNYGTAAAGLLEAEIVTADGTVRIANACTNPDLFWAIKGGGGGSLGVVTKMTLRTHELPEFFGGVFTTIQALSDAAFRQLIGQFMNFYSDRLLNPHWGEIATVRPDNTLVVRMAFQALDPQQAEEVWQPFLGWVTDRAEHFKLSLPPRIIGIPARHLWDPAYLKVHEPGAVLSDDRPGAPADNVFWAGNLAEAGHFLFGFESVWLPASLLHPEAQDRLADALYSATRHWQVELHFQKGLFGALEKTLADVRDTAMNPAVLDAFVLAIVAGEGPPAYPGLHGRGPDLSTARLHARQIEAAMHAIKGLAPEGGCYVAESSFFESEWQKAYWGPHYPRLLAIKKKYDPTGLFFAHHGVGSEEWSADGMTKLARP